MKTTLPAAHFVTAIQVCAALLAVTGSFAVRLPAAAAAEPDSTPIPITINSCTVDEDNAMMNEKIGFRDSSAGGFVIAYTVDTDSAAKEVRFVVRYYGRYFAFVDRGSFAPHAEIRHEFNKVSVPFSGGSVDCRVASATFADGSRWQAPGGAPAAPLQR